MNILFVCLGNICRSPIAEAIFKHQIEKLGLNDQFFADSCGTANYHVGHNPDYRTIKNALKNGVEVHHKGRQIAHADLETFDLILAMDNHNLNSILKLSGAEKYFDKIRLMRSYDPISVGDVPDPYYGSEQDFQEVFEILDRSIKNLIQNQLIKS